MGQGVPVKQILASALIALLLLSGCGSEKADHEGFTLGLAAAKKLVAGKTAIAPPPTYTRAALDQAAAPLLRAQIEKGGTVAFLGVIGQGRGVVTWASVDGISLSLRDGVVLATRGMGTDLMSAEVPTAAALATTSADQRRHFYLFGGEVEQERAFDCVLRNAGRDRLTVIELVYDTRHRVETCTGPGGLTFENHYWFDNRAIIRQSRQWISPDVGFLELQNLNR